SGRGGKGIRATDTSKTDEIGKLVSLFPVEASDQILLVSDGGQLIRVPVNGIRIAGRSTKGVTIFNTADGEKVVSVERISETETDEIEAETVLEGEVVSSDTTDGSEEI
ncbi:DNA gyrase C-terminal beta-propeller domain-containing protein, partial [Phyllobacterium sp. P5_D12]